MKAVARIFSVLTLATLVVACASKTSSGDEDDGIVDIFAPKPFHETSVRLPAPPVDQAALPFVVGQSTLNFAVDPKSVSVGSDDVVRYTVIITSSTGARNVSFEGIRCYSRERKLYATLRTSDNTWTRNMSKEEDGWLPMTSLAANAYGRTLAEDFFCEGRGIAGPAEKLVQRIRDEGMRKPLIY
jgi:hypothetical protein